MQETKHIRTALDEDGNVVDIDDVPDELSERHRHSYECRLCHRRMIASRGHTGRAFFFRHESAVDCDPWYEGMTEWHKAWQDRFPKEWQEVVLSDGTEQHRADVMLPNGHVIEFQHSPIGDDFDRRNAFYSKQAGLTWVFDCTREGDESWFGSHISLARHGDACSFEFRWAPGFIMGFDVIGQAEDGVQLLLDVGDACGGGHSLLVVTDVDDDMSPLSGRCRIISCDSFVSDMTDGDTRQLTSGRVTTIFSDGTRKSSIAYEGRRIDIPCHSSENFESVGFYLKGTRDEASNELHMSSPASDVTYVERSIPYVRVTFEDSESGYSKTAMMPHGKGIYLPDGFPRHDGKASGMLEWNVFGPTKPFTTFTEGDVVTSRHFHRTGECPVTIRQTSCDAVKVRFVMDEDAFSMRRRPRTYETLVRRGHAIPVPIRKDLVMPERDGNRMLYQFSDAALGDRTDIDVNVIPGVTKVPSSCYEDSRDGSISVSVAEVTPERYEQAMAKATFVDLVNGRRFVLQMRHERCQRYLELSYGLPPDVSVPAESGMTFVGWYAKGLDSVPTCFDNDAPIVASTTYYATYARTGTQDDARGFLCTRQRFDEASRDMSS